MAHNLTNWPGFAPPPWPTFAPPLTFSGFWSQSDGACFGGYLGHAKGVSHRIRDYAPQDTILHGIADRLQAIQRRNFYQLTAEVSHRGRYYHEYTMSVNVTRDNPIWQAPPRMQKKS